MDPLHVRNLTEMLYVVHRVTGQFLRGSTVHLSDVYDTIIEQQTTRKVLLDIVVSLRR
jgi:hypothetical protein